MVFDLFKNNHVMGRFVLVDGYNVCGGGIISGEAEQVLTSSVIKSGGITMDVRLFDEYYFIPVKAVVSHRPGHLSIYGLGDIVPLESKSFSYPNDFDLINMEQGNFAKIRGAHVEALGKLDDYIFTGNPLIDADGCAIAVSSAESWQDFYKVARNKVSSEFLNCWLDFGK